LKLVYNWDIYENALKEVLCCNRGSKLVLFSQSAVAPAFKSEMDVKKDEGKR
jgi:hypothetical protein